MKRFWTLLLCLAMLLTCSGVAALAEDIDLSGMTLDELRALKERVTMAMWETEEWKQATLVPGVYKIGTDIPAGHWDITAADTDYAHVIWCSELDHTGKSCDDSDRLHGMTVMDEDYKFYEKYWGLYPATIDLDMYADTYLIVEQGNVVLTPYKGNDNMTIED